MQTGLIGGIGPAAPDVQYFGMIGHAAKAGRALDVTIVHADTPRLLGNLMAGNVAANAQSVTG